MVVLETTFIVFRALRSFCTWFFRNPFKIQIVYNAECSTFCVWCERAQ